MPIALHLPAVLARLTDGQSVVEGSGETVGAVLTDVTTRYPALAPRLRDETGAPHPFVTIYVNDDDVRLAGGLHARVRDGDEITVVPAIAGG